MRQKGKVRIVDNIQLKLCDIQGRLFERSTAYASEGFIRDFMNSEVAKHLDSPYNKLQWMGEEYLLDELKDEKNLSPAGKRTVRKSYIGLGICIGSGRPHEMRRAGRSTGVLRQRR